MASIEETRQALETQQQRALELAEKSFTAIDSVMNTANFWLTSLSILIGLIALVGLGAVYFGATRMAKKVAETRLSTYIKNGEAVITIRKGIEDEVKVQIEGRSFVIVQPPSPDNGEESFKKDTKGG